jgi:hypothetical protein
MPESVWLAPALKQINKLTQAREIQLDERGEVAAQILVLDALDAVSSFLYYFGR